MKKTILWKEIVFVSGIVTILVSASIPISLICLDDFYAKKSDEIYRSFSSWCDSSRYLLVQKGVHTLEINREEIDLENDLEELLLQSDKNVKNISFMNSILYSGDCFYCCGIEEKSNSSNCLVIYKTLFEDLSTQRILSFESHNNNLKHAFESAFGYNEKGYFKIDERFFEYNFYNKQLDELDEKDDKTNLCIFNNYSETLNVVKTKCYSKDDSITFYLENIKYEFDQKIIDSNKLLLIKKYDFKPEWCVSFENGTTSFVYYSGSRLLGYGECLITTYNRFTGNTIDFQLISHTYFDMKNTILAPQVDI